MKVILKVSSSLRKTSTCVEVILLNVWVKCTQTPLVCLYLKNKMFDFFLIKLDTFKSMI